MRLTVSGARLAIVWFSLGITGFLLCFLLVAPEIGVPFNPGRHENQNLVFIVLPVFFGYLGSAAHFVVRTPRSDSKVDEQLLSAMVFGPFCFYILINIVLFTTFVLANREGGSGMIVEELSKWFSLTLGLLTCTISIISARLFK